MTQELEDALARDTRRYIVKLETKIERLQAALRDALAMVETFASGSGMSHSGRAEFNRLATLCDVYNEKET